VFFQVPDAPKPFFGRGSVPDPVGELMMLPQIPIRLGRAEIPILWVFQLSLSPPKEAEARQICPGFFLKSLLEICLIKFVDTLYIIGG